MKHLTNNNNSCYIDSLFTVLFSIADVKRLFRNAKTTRAREIRKTILDMDVNAFRMSCHSDDRHNDGENWLTDQKEPLDILLFIKNHMNFPNDIRYRETHYLKKSSSPNAKCTTFVKENLKRCDFFSYKFFTPSSNNTKLTFDSVDYIDKGNGQTKVIKQKFISSSSLLMVHINRNQGNSSKNTTEIIVPKTSKCMELAGIIVHKGSSISSGHYIGYFKKNNKWYKYDDMKSEVEPVVGNLNSNVFRNCTDVFYINK